MLDRAEGEEKSIVYHLVPIICFFKIRAKIRYEADKWNVKRVNCKNSLKSALNCF